ncbi:MAG: two-component sensor histidine kinase [Leeuwenhoekiella sp.]|nr:two-component sensor histidine kinase [Leeuwenhoekiella sp.]HCW65316.1 sensor histidine kinase [Leeuwenhoekiella sp.]
MVISGVVLFFSIKILLESEIEEELYSNKNRVELILESDPEHQGIPPVIEVEKVNRDQQRVLNDTLIYDPLQDEIELFRQLSQTKLINGQHYKITVRAMVIESENILVAIVSTFLIIILLAFLFLFYFNTNRNKKLWEPFFINLNKIKSFSIKERTDLNLIDSGIIEFDELNKELKALTAKVYSDYQNLKQFTEDISHEIQTPLAVMQAKIDTLVNATPINQEQYQQFTSLENDIRKLKNLNKRLILLAKIDNNQFVNDQIISLKQIFEEAIENMTELSSATFKLKSNADPLLRIDPTLAVVLCNNLLSNAIKHNYKDNEILVEIEVDNVQVLNQGKAPINHPEHIFNRFYRESRNKDSSGLGLSIVKKVCEQYGYLPSYMFKAPETKASIFGYHCFKIQF